MKKFKFLEKLREKRADAKMVAAGYEFYNVLSPNSPYNVAESYRNLYANITYLPIEGKCKKIAITSAAVGEGKTTVSVNLAITLAQNTSNARILLIDTNLRKPDMELMLPRDYQSRGLSEFLSGEDEKPNIVASSVDGLFVLYAGQFSLNPMRLIGSEKMAELVRYCEEHYDYIIMDTTALGVSSEALLLKKNVDGYVIVTKSQNSNVDSIGEAIESLRTLGAKIFGIVLTGEPVKREGKRRWLRRG